MTQDFARALVEAGYMPLTHYLDLCSQHGWTPAKELVNG